MLLSEAAEPVFARHESFQPRYGWFRKAYEAAARDPRAFARRDATVRLGVGRNMVRAIRFWGLAAKIIQEEPGAANRRSPDIVPAEMGRALFDEPGWDPYMEDPGTLWLLHWLILAPRCLIPVWWIALYDFPAVEFTGSELKEAAASQVKAVPNWTMPALSSIKKDVNILFRAYDPLLRSRPDDGDDQMECPLRSLGLIENLQSDGRYRFRVGPKATLPSEIVAYAALDYISRIRAGEGTIPLSRLAYDPGSPGRAFKLSETDLAIALEPTVELTRQINLENRTGFSHLAWKGDPAATAKFVLEKYYDRVWHGPDVDVSLLLQTAQEQVQGRTLAEILSSVDDPQPMVAARHSAQYDVLRVFSRRYADGSVEVEPPGPFSSYDGEALMVVDDSDTLPRMLRSHTEAKPVVAALPKDVSDLEAVAREIAAVTIALDDPTAQGDRVARRELRERLGRARRFLEHALVAAFGADSCRWVLLREGGGGRRPLSPGRGSAALSDAADIAYPDTPRVRNEMLNRNSLTSQGKKARRKLLKAMVERGDQTGLGFEGYGPEVAIYKAVLEATGMHGLADPDQTMGFRSPTDECWEPVWGIMTEEFRRAENGRIDLIDLHAVLRSPPVGMKVGVIPVFVLAGLLASPGGIAVYEHGVSMPLTAELAGRMADDPGHFSLGPVPDSGS